MMAAQELLGEDTVPLTTSSDDEVELEARETPQRWSPKILATRGALLALLGVAATGCLLRAGRGSLETLGAEPHVLMDTCNPQVIAPQPVSPAFNIPGNWGYFCKGQGSQPVPPPPSETEKFPGQQNYCWNWMKHKGCKDVIAKLNWHDAQAATAGAQLAPDPAMVPMEPMQNPTVCQAYELGATLYPQPAEAQAAKTWLATNVAVYVLTLPAEAERMQFMQGRLNELGIQFSFLQGVDLRVQGSYAKAKTDGIIPMDFDFQRADANGGGVAGMVGVAAAHLGAMQTVATNGAQQPMALVLENDVRLEDDFAVKLYNLLSQETPCDWQAVSLKSACPYGACITQHLTRVMPDPNEPEGRCRHGVNYGFYGMLYKVQTLNDLRAKLSQRVWNPDVPHCLDVDVALASISDQVAYYAVPFWQAPGLLQMGGHGSSRTDNNHAPVDTTEPR